MNPFEWQEPQTFEEALSLIDTDDPGVRPVAGGTALMLMMKAGVFSPSKLVSLHCVEAAHCAIRLTGNGVRIGALATLSSEEISYATFDFFLGFVLYRSRQRAVRVRRQSACSQQSC